MLLLGHAGNEKEFMLEFKCLCAELFMSTMIWIVVITMKNVFCSIFSQLLASIRNRCRQYRLPKEKEGIIWEQVPGGNKIHHLSDLN